MTNQRNIILAGKKISVPPLPIRLNMIAYPKCRDLSNGDLFDRIAVAAGAVDCTAEEMAELAELAYIAAKAADPSLEREAFDEWPISPPELLDAFFIIRYQTGGWIEKKEDGESPGEAKGAKKKPPR